MSMTQRIDIEPEHVTEAVHLLVKTREGSKVWDLNEFINIGRAPENQISLPDPFVSQRHARIEKNKRGYLLRDMRSRNGTSLNGGYVMEAYLSDGDHIKIGNTDIYFITQAAEALPGELKMDLKSQNKAWQEQLEKIPAIAKSEWPVLICGPSGTGKELITECIHSLSLRKTGRLISVNCSALSPALIESELFGHVKGSFTDASNDRKGAFESARGGTLFLDEIGDLPAELQPKLLRALENLEIKPVGSDKTIKIDTRIVAATSHNLRERVRQGLFRLDLFYRLNVITLSPPSLQNRMEDFEKLLYSFAKKYKVRFAHGAIAELKRHSWPGNIRELKNLVARAKTMFEGVYIQAEHVHSLIDLPIEKNSSPALPADTKGESVIKKIEKQLIIESLESHGGNQRRTAEHLGIPKSTLNDRLRRYGII